MKAIRKSDGKIIDVEVHGWRSDRAISYHTNFKDFYKPEDLDFNVAQNSELSVHNTSSFDWQSFRAEVTKDILSKLITIGAYDSQNFGSISNPDYRKIFVPCYTKECAVTKAIEIADELCKQLKEKEEK